MKTFSHYFNHKLTAFSSVAILILPITRAITWAMIPIVFWSWVGASSCSELCTTTTSNSTSRPIGPARPKPMNYYEILGKFKRTFIYEFDLLNKTKVFMKRLLFILGHIGGRLLLSANSVNGLQFWWSRQIVMSPFDVVISNVPGGEAGGPISLHWDVSQ